LGAFFFLAFFFLGFGAGTTLKLPLTLVNFLAFLSAVFSSLLLMVAPVAAMAFLMAGSEEPPRSLSVTMAAVASSDVVGPVLAPDKCLHLCVSSVMSAVSPSLSNSTWNDISSKFCVVTVPIYSLWMPSLIMNCTSTLALLSGMLRST
jgi:hypothetical protein